MKRKLKNITKINCLLFLFFFNFLFSQVTYKGVTIDKNDKVLPRTLIQVFDKDTINVLSYAISNNEGKYIINFENTERVVFKISAYNYENYYSSEIIKTESTNLNFTLTKKSTILKEVIIIGNQRTAKVSKDSISYNLKTIRDSTETNLGDLIKKLPGLEISSDGKVKFQGITVDKILIDSNEYFGNKHQIATENISANMVEGIDLLLKHNDNINLKEFGENSKIALNIKLNSKSKNIISGNIDASGGISNKYASHSNIFKFLKKGNVSLISDFNNIGDMPLTVPDYFDIIGGVESISNQSIGVTDVNEMIPDYIYNEDKRKERKNLFSAFNLSYKNNKLKINSNIFFNNFNQLEQRLNYRVFLDNTTPLINESYTNVSTFFLFNSNFKIQYAINSKSNIKYLFNIVPTNGNSKEGIENNFSINTKSNKENLIINNQINYQYKINDKFLFTSDLGYKMDKIINDFNINSNDNNIFNLNSNNFYQNYFYQNNRFNNTNSLLFKNDNNKYKYSLSFDNNNENLETKIFPISFKNNISRDIKNIINKIDITQYISEKFFLKYQLTSNSYSTNSKSTDLIDNYFSINYNLNAANNFSISYQNNNKVIELVKQLSSNYIVNYQSINTPNNIENNIFLNKKSFSFAFSNYKSRIEQFFNLNLTYSFANQNSTTNTTYVNNYSLFSYQLGEDNKNFWGVVIYDRKITSLPLIIKSSFSLDYITNINFIKSISNSSKYSKSILDINLTSSFKKIKTQFQLSYLSDYVNFKQSLVSEKYNLLTQNIGFKIISKINSFKIEPSLNYLVQTGSISNNYNTLLGIKIGYSDEQNKFTYFIRSNNLFNVKNFEQKTQTSNNFIIENTIHSMIPGYILFGIKFNY